MPNQHLTYDGGTRPMSGSRHVVHVSERSETDSIRSYSSSDSSLGFRDFENGTIYDQVVQMDTPDGQLQTNEENLPDSQGTKVDKLKIQNSTGVIIGNQTFIEGTVILDGINLNDTFMEQLQHKLSIGDWGRKTSNDANFYQNGKRESKHMENRSRSSLHVPAKNPKKSLSKCKKAMIVIVVIVILVIIIGSSTVLIIRHFKPDNPGTEAPATTKPPLTTRPSTTETPTTETPTTQTPTSEPPTTEPSTSEIPPTEPTPTPEPYKFISRSEWGSNRPPDDLEPINHPVKSIVITETGTNSCTTESSCSAIVREEQVKFQRMSWIDIGHSFVAAGFNAIYEGRGWNASGQHSRPHGSNCYVIAFIGKFQYRQPTKDQINAYMGLIEDGVKNKYIDKEYEMVAHCQVAGVSRPGEELRKLMITWPHWTNTTKQC